MVNFQFEVERRVRDEAFDAQANLRSEGTEKDAPQLRSDGQVARSATPDQAGAEDSLGLRLDAVEVIGPDSLAVHPDDH